MQSNNVTRLVNFNRTKIGGQCQNVKIRMRHLWWFSNNVHKNTPAFTFATNKKCHWMKNKTYCTKTRVIISNYWTKKLTFKKAINPTIHKHHYHSVCNSEEESHSTLLFNNMSEESYVYFLSGQKLNKEAKNWQFGELLKDWSLWSNSVTRQVNFNRTNIGQKCQNQEI